MAILAIRKLADKTTGTRVAKFDPVTGERKLINPATPGDNHEPWPLAGVQFEGDAPDETSVPTKTVDTGIAEGWISRVNEHAVVRPAGPHQDVWASTHNGTPHTFIHCDEIVFHMVDGDYRYRVVQQPDKYAVVGEEVINEDKNNVRQVIDRELPVTPEMYEAGQTRVTHFYRVERIDG